VPGQWRRQPGRACSGPMCGWPGFGCERRSSESSSLAMTAGHRCGPCRAVLATMNHDPCASRPWHQRNHQSGHQWRVRGRGRWGKEPRDRARQLLALRRNRQALYLIGIAEWQLGPAAPHRGASGPGHRSPAHRHRRRQSRVTPDDRPCTIPDAVEAATGEATRIRDPPALDQLTSQEQHIAGLVADGLTNAGIATRFSLPNHRLPPAQSVHRTRDRFTHRAGPPGAPQRTTG
jgi:hypothetical protein